MKNKCLLISPYNDYGANSICARNIAKELSARGNTVVVLSSMEEGYQRYEKEDTIEIYRISPSVYDKTAKKRKKKDNFFLKIAESLLSIIRLAYAIPAYPKNLPIQTYLFYKKSKELFGRYHFDIVVGIYRPYEMVDATLRLKRALGADIKAVTYHLDLLSSPVNKNKAVRNFKIWKARRAFRHELSICDRCLLPVSSREMPETKDSKVAFCDFPLYVRIHENKKQVAFNFPKETINLVYVGTLGGHNRDPMPLITLVERLPVIRGKIVQLHVWGRIEDNETELGIRNSPAVIYHGVIGNEMVPRILAAADFLLNISNKVVYQMVPSKIFQLFASNKPIINMVQHEKDASLSYFERIRCCINIKMYESGEQLPLLEQFINRYYGAVIENPSDLFGESTPEFVVDLIESIMSN